MFISLKFYLNSLNKIWLNFYLLRRLLLITILTLALSFSNFAFWPIDLLQQEVTFNNGRSTKDITTLLSANVESLLTEENSKAINNLCEQYYKNSPILKYIIFFDIKSEKAYSIPFNFTDSIFNHSKTLGSDSTMTVTTFLNSDETIIGILILGVNSNQNLINNSKLTWLLFTLILITFLFTLILGILFAILTLARPIKEISKGIERIAGANFEHKVNLAVGGEVGNLILQFNEMGRKLQKYEEKTVDQILNEKLKFENLAGTIADGTILLDTNLRLVFLNEAALEILGLSNRKNLVGSKLWQHLSPPAQKKLFFALESLVKTGSSQIFYSFFPDSGKNSDDRFARLILNIIYDSQAQFQRPKGITITVQDSTKELRVAQIRAEFTANISHELRTPLFNIRSFIETTQDYNSNLSTYKKRQFLETVQIESLRLTRLVNNILNLSQLDSVTINSSASFKIDQVLQQAVVSYQFLAQAKRIRLKTYIIGKLPIALGHFDLITQVIVNLIGNSLKFTYPGGEIIIRAYTLKRQLTSKIRVEIIDTGIGISPTFRKIVFKRFIREENQVHNLKGTGLGLSIVEAILRKHQASIYLLTKPNVGTLFWFDLTITN